MDKAKAEKIKIQRDRLNMFIQILPLLLANPLIQGLIWWRLSKVIPDLAYFNKIVVGSVVIDAVPFVDVDVQALPDGLVMGSALAEASNSDNYVDWLKENHPLYGWWNIGGEFPEKGIGQEIDLSKFFTWWGNLWNIDLSKEATGF